MNRVVNLFAVSVRSLAFLERISPRINFCERAQNRRNVCGEGRSNLFAAGMLAMKGRRMSSLPTSIAF